MISEMRRKKQLLSEEECREVLNHSTSGVLSLNDLDGYPYGVPLSYVLVDNKIYFHSALEGHKIDCIRTSDKASFCVIDKDEIIEEKFTTHFRSVIAFGNVRIIEDEEEKRRTIELLALKYSPHHIDGIPTEIEHGIKRMIMIEFSIIHLSGKEAIELVLAKNK